MVLVLLFFWGSNVGAITKNVDTQQTARSQRVEQLIIKLKPQAVSGGMKAAGAPTKLSFSQVQGFIARAGVELSVKRSMSGGAQVLKLPYAMTQDEIANVVDSLKDDPDIEYVEPDWRLYPMLEPNDTYYISKQWHYKAATDEPGAANLPGAWGDTTGDAGLVVAVLDTGLLPHEDIDNARIAPGYDFISDYRTANEDETTDSTDNDPTDPGDWITSADAAGSTFDGFFKDCEVSSSSWHGTHVAGTIGADTNDGDGVAGVNWNSQILPVRVLGKCGGTTSDIVDGMRWAAGIPGSGADNNPNVAKVLNLSFGGPSLCDKTMQSAINEVVAAGAVVVVAAGNDDKDAKNYQPAGCDNVITVAAVNRAGGKASFSNYGSTVEIAAPGGGGPAKDGSDNILSTLNNGTKDASDDVYAYYQGTSMSAPHVAGIVSLLLSLDNRFTPAQVSKKLQATARTFPTDTGDDCTKSLCGAGIIDAEKLITTRNDPVAWIETDNEVTTGDTVILSGTGSFDINGTVDSYLWKQTDGTDVIISGSTTSTASFTAPSAPGTVTISLTVKDNNSNSHTMSTDIVVTAPSSSGSSSSTSTACFIATAAFGTSMQAEVRYLRAFRDDFLLTNKLGQAFVKAYYKHSPPLADFIRQRPTLRSITRVVLKPLIWLSQAIVSDETFAQQGPEAP